MQPLSEIYILLSMHFRKENKEELESRNVTTLA